MRSKWQKLHWLGGRKLLTTHWVQPSGVGGIHWQGWWKQGTKRGCRLANAITESTTQFTYLLFALSRKIGQIRNYYRPFQPRSLANMQYAFHSRKRTEKFSPVKLHITCQFRSCIIIRCGPTCAPEETESRQSGARLLDFRSWSLLATRWNETPRLRKD